MTNASIAKTLGIRPGTVEFHVSGILGKAGVTNRAGLIASQIRGRADPLRLRGGSMLGERFTSNPRHKTPRPD